jgi:hypothetical protein
MISVSITLVGTLPLLVHAQEGMNPSNPYAKEFSILNKKRNKQDDDRERISDLEMRLGLYWDMKKDVPCLPAFNVIRSVQDGGKMMKLGKKIIQGIRIMPNCLDFEIVYDPKLPFEKFLVEPAHRDVRTVTVGTSVISRTRPRFDVWGLRGILFMDPEILSIEELNECIKKAGLYFGLGDFRVGTDKGGRFGTYEGAAKVITMEEAERWN